MMPVAAAEQLVDASQVAKELELKEAALLEAQQQITPPADLIMALKDEIGNLKHQLGIAETEARIYKKMAGQDED